MSASADKVTLKIDVDNTDALRKIRQVRRAFDQSRSTSDLVLSALLSLFALAWMLAGFIEHSAFDMSTACLFLIAAKS